MTEHDNGEISPDENFELGLSAGEEIAREQLAGQLAEQGFNDAEIQEALFGNNESDLYKPKRVGSRKQCQKMPQMFKCLGGGRMHDPKRKRHTVSVATASGARKVHKGRKPILIYDPATGGYRARARAAYAAAKPKIRKAAKGLVKKAEKLAIPGAAGVTLYAGYSQRLTDMKADPVKFKNPDGTPVTTMMQAIKWDIDHFVLDDAVGRVKDNIGVLGGVTIAGYVLDRFKLAGRYSKLASKLVYGIAGGQLVKTVLDPPAGENMTTGVSAAQAAIMEAQSRQVYNPPVQNYPSQSYQAAPAPVQLYEQNNSLPVYADEGSRRL